jgi:hypothetical protein
VRRRKPHTDSSSARLRHAPTDAHLRAMPTDLTAMRSQACSTTVDHRTQTCYWLPEHVFSCNTPDGLVLLDARRNRYHGLPHSHAKSLRAMVPNLPTDVSTRENQDALTPSETLELVDTMIELNLLQLVPPRSARPLDIKLQPQRSLQAIGFGTEFDYRVGPDHLTRFVNAYTGALVDMHFKALFETVRRISDQRKHDPEVTGIPTVEQLTRLVSIFRRIRHHVFSGHGRCLLHSLTLIRFLSLFDVSATLVVGVRTSPWAAHSWVERDGYTLDATPEKVRMFTPILAV